MNDDLRARLRATFMDEADELLAALNTEVMSLERAPADPVPRRAVFRIFHTLKGAARAAGVTDMERAAHEFEGIVADLPSASAVDPPRIAALFAAADALGGALGRLRRGDELDKAAPPLAASRPPEAAPPVPFAPVPFAPVPSASAPLPAATVRVRADRLEELAGSAVEVVSLAGRTLHNSERLALLAEAFAQAAPGRVVTARDRSAREQDRVLAREARALARGATGDSRLLAQRARELREHVRSVRLRPFADACEALPRMARDLAAQLGKEVDLQVKGGAVEADRAVIDALRDPLVQLVRNALDHGLETPSARLHAGKPARGTITVGASLVADRLLVTVADDGRGVDAAALRRRLSQRGGAEAAVEQTALGRQLLSAGISTREAATSVSGRGVGIELVRRAVEGLGGRVDVDWAEGRGTVFTLECPSSLAATRVVLLSVGDRTLAVPTVAVDRLVRVRPDAVRTVQGRPSLALASGMVPIASLAALLGPPLADRTAGGIRPALVLRDGEERLVITVDGLLAETEVVVKPVEGTGTEQAAGVTGAALLASGVLALVVNVAEVLRRARGVARPTAATPDRRTVRILIADDSITTRTLERTLLEEAGYEVVVAVDGEEAWTRLGEGGIDLVLADVEMPNLDGLGLCRRIRADARTRGLPVVLVTSLGSPDDRRRGAEAGADAYVAKSEFESEALLGTIRQLLDESTDVPGD